MTDEIKKLLRFVTGENGVGTIYMPAWLLAEYNQMAYYKKGNFVSRLTQKDIEEFTIENLSLSGIKDFSHVNLMAEKEDVISD